MWHQAEVSLDELEDFYAGVLSAGCDPATFDVTARQEEAQHGPIKRIVTVMRGQHQRDFESVNGQDWTVPAIKAVRMGQFEGLLERWSATTSAGLAPWLQ